MFKVALRASYGGFVLARSCSTLVECTLTVGFDFSWSSFIAALKDYVVSPAVVTFLTRSGTGTPISARAYRTSSVVEWSCAAS